MSNPYKRANGQFRAADIDEVAIRGMIADGLTRKQIIDRIRCSPKTLRKFLDQHGLDPVRCKNGVAPAPAPATVSGALWSVRLVG